MRHATFVVAAAAAIVTACNGRNPAPTAPSMVPQAVAGPVVRAVTVDRTHVEAGSEVALAASLDTAVTPGPLRFVWTVTPPGGSLASDGATARWRAPANDPVPAAYVFSVAVIASGSGATSPLASTTSNHADATSPPVMVNDARRETQAHATAFLSDLANPNISPSMCVRNFTDSCGAGKQGALNDATALRTQYSAGATSYTLQLFLRSVEWANCTGPDGSAICALLVYTVDTVWTRRTDGGGDRTHGYQYLRAVYEQNRWSLCSSRFDENPSAVR